MDLEFTVTESITRYQGHVYEIIYEFEEVTVESGSLGMTSKKERRSRMYEVTISREQYNHLAKQISNALPFDQFIYVLRPFIMGHYNDMELERAFDILDKDNSGSIHIDELSSFLPIINPNATSDALKNYISKVDNNADQNLDYDEFRSLILKGIGRDIVCNHI